MTSLPEQGFRRGPNSYLSKKDLDNQSGEMECGQDLIHCSAPMSTSVAQPSSTCFKSETRPTIDNSQHRSFTLHAALDFLLYIPYHLPACTYIVPKDSSSSILRTMHLMSRQVLFWTSLTIEALDSSRRYQQNSFNSVWDYHNHSKSNFCRQFLQKAILLLSFSLEKVLSYVVS